MSSPSPPHISPARGQRLWEGCDAQVDDGVQRESDWHLAAPPAPDYEVDQRVNWRWQIACFRQIEGALKVRYLAP